MIESHNIRIWVLAELPSPDCLERLGDARRLANDMGLGVGALVLHGEEATVRRLIEGGADLVVVADAPADRHWPLRRKVCFAFDTLSPRNPRVIFAGGDPPAREWAALLAAECSWQFVSPTLITNWKDGQVVITRLDASGKRSCQTAAAADRPVVVTLRAGVAERWTEAKQRTGEIRYIVPHLEEEDAMRSEIIPADPETVDIRHATRLVAGGRGLGGPEGFNLLRRFANKIDASVAASRIAVDLGWIEFERQVGQTGKTVEPDLYIACGISGASHHLQGMRDAEHVIAINTDPHAPIFDVANLAIVADLHSVLESGLEALNVD